MSTGVTSAMSGTAQSVVSSGSLMSSAMTSAAGTTASAFSSAAASTQITGSVMAAAMAMAASNASASFSSAASQTQTSAADIAVSMDTAAVSSAESMGAVASSVEVLANAQPVAAALSQGICDNVLSPMTALKAATTAAGAAAGAGFVAGLASKRSAVISVANSIANAARAAISAALKIESPSKVMRRAGEYTAEGLALGLEDMIPRVADSASAVARTVERSAAITLPLPGTAPASVPAVPRSRTVESAASQTDLSALTERMDRLLDYFHDTEPVLRLDGRAFGRMVREYA